MPTPRLTIRNVATHHLLYAGSSWNATVSSGDEEGKRPALFKVQWSEQMSDKVAKTVLIRTDRHPQSLLDVRDLTYQGGFFDGKKCYDKDRWWRLTWLEIAEGGKLTVLFQSYTQGTYLAERKNAEGVEMIPLDDHINLNEVPDRAKWQLTIGGRAFHPNQPGGVQLGVSKVIAGLTDENAITGAVELMAAAFAASDTTTLAASVGTTSALIAADAQVSGISATTRNELSGILKKVSKEFFVNW